MHSPLDFMYDEYSEHKKIFNMRNKWEYMMLSSGTNQFPMPRLWKETIAAEIDTDFTYQLYVSPYGFDTVNKSITAYENFLSTKGHMSSGSVRNNDVCMTIGASQAVFLIMKYLRESRGADELHIVGYNYALYEKLARKRGLIVSQVTGRENFIPSLEELLEYIDSCNDGSIVLFTHPNNPSGEQYTQKEYDEIIHLLKNKKMFVVFDVACNMIISSGVQVFVQPSVTTHGYWSNCVIINSFSKTESTAGLRIGYIYGDSNVVNYIYNEQSIMLMVLPSFPVLPIFFTTLFRCLYLNENHFQKKYADNLLIRSFKRLFYYTTSIPNKSVCDYIEAFFDDIKSHYDRYIKELLENERVIKRNFKYATDTLEHYILSVSKMQSGFNFMIKLRYLDNFSESEFVSEILKDTGLAILTESAFSLNPPSGLDFYFRVSLACPEDVFKKGIGKLDAFLLRQNK